MVYLNVVSESIKSINFRETVLRLPLPLFKTLTTANSKHFAK